MYADARCFDDAIASKTSTHGLVTTALVESVDMYPSLAVLAGLPPPAEGCPGCIEGHSAAALLDNPHQEWKKASFSQYGRCNVDADGYYSRCSGLPREEIQVMGYSARTADYRYTEWCVCTGVRGVRCAVCGVRCAVRGVRAPPLTMR